MNSILVQSAEPTFAVATCLSKVIDADPRVAPADTSADQFVRELIDPGVVLGVLALADGAWDIVARSTVPLVLVPPASESKHVGQYELRRVLVPLDGTDEAAHAVAATVRLFRTAGIEIVVLHVFDEHTVPAHWDQAAHARDAWETEFLARYCDPCFPDAPLGLTLRSGAPGQRIVDLAAEQADMIVLGWSQQLLPGRARIVRQAVSAATVPVLLIPAGAPDTASIA